MTYEYLIALQGYNEDYLQHEVLLSVNKESAPGTKLKMQRLSKGTLQGGMHLI